MLGPGRKGRLEQLVVQFVLRQRQRFALLDEFGGQHDVLRQPIDAPGLVAQPCQQSGRPRVADEARQQRVRIVARQLRHVDRVHAVDLAVERLRRDDDAVASAVELDEGRDFAARAGINLVYTVDQDQEAAGVEA